VRRAAFLLAAAGAGAMLILATPGAAERAVPIPAAKLDVPRTGGLQTAVLAGGCFWGMEAVFEHVRGVRSVTSGYAGGTRATATYDQVSTETTRHAEAVRVVFDPAQVSYAQLLRVYFSAAHDPTQVNRQGPDSGPSYRSAVFPQTPEQERVARAYVAQLTAARSFNRPIATRIEHGAFFPAEAYHPYIVAWDRPKLAAFRAAFPSLAT
jgi:peptide-methionine (S)-S-oxide reductase